MQCGVDVKNLWLGCVPIFLALSPSLPAQDQGTAFIRLLQPDSPARFVRTRNNVKEDLLKFATLKNLGDTSITSYRIGWVAMYDQGNDKVGLGLPVGVPDGINPGQTVEVPAQGVSPTLLSERPLAIVFSVAEIHTAGDATWKPELAQIEWQARHTVASLPSN